MTDVLAHPSPAGLDFRRAQLEYDRARLLRQMEAEQLVPVSPPPTPAPTTMLDLALLRETADRVMRRWGFHRERRARILALAPNQIAACCDLDLADYERPIR